MGKMMLAAVLASLGLASPLPAQDPPDTLPGILEQAQTRRWIVRVTADTAVIHQGVITAYTDSSLTIAERQVRLDEISLLERRVSDRTVLKSGVVVGGLAGLVLGAGLVAFACGYDPDCGGDTIFLLGGALTAGGAAIGGVLGGLLGGYEWTAVWRKR